MDRQCPHCGNPVYDEDALRCCFCGELITRNIGFLGKMRAKGFDWIIAVLIVAALLTMMFL